MKGIISSSHFFSTGQLFWNHLFDWRKIWERGRGAFPDRSCPIGWFKSKTNLIGGKSAEGGWGLSPPRTIPVGECFWNSFSLVENPGGEGYLIYCAQYFYWSTFFKGISDWWKNRCGWRGISCPLFSCWSLLSKIRFLVSRKSGGEWGCFLPAVFLFGQKKITGNFWLVGNCWSHGTVTQGLATSFDSVVDGQLFSREGYDTSKMGGGLFSSFFCASCLHEVVFSRHTNFSTKSCVGRKFSLLLCCGRPKMYRFGL